jgi:1-acyl-sn-glycerol-3-phosphate acyltransferase
VRVCRLPTELRHPLLADIQHEVKKFNSSVQFFRASCRFLSILKAVRRQNVKVWCNPERSVGNGEIGQFKREAFSVAIKAQLPVVPVVFSIYNEFEVIATVLPPIPTKRLNEVDVDDLAHLTRENMIRVYNQTSQEMKENPMKASERCSA